jgi:tetratricopeptide (TPR) repeat protein
MAARDNRNSARRTADNSGDLETAFAHHQAGRLDRAEALYRKVLQRAPDDVNALNLLGVIAHERGRHEYAVQLSSRAVARMPEFAEAHMNLGRTLRELGRLDEAAASCRRAIVLKPDFAAAHCNLSIIYNLQGAFEAALESAGRAIELMPELTEAHLNLAAALVGQRRFAEAETAYRSALAQHPDSAEILCDLGRVLIELRRVDEAVACHRRAVELKPDSAIVHLMLGGTLLQAGDPHAGEESCRRATALDPNLATGWSGLGQVLRPLGRFDEALSCFQHALELDPDLPDAHAGLALIGKSADDEGQIQRLRALLVSPEHLSELRIEAGFAAGMLLDNADRYDEAFACFSEANSLYRRLLAASGTLFDRAALRQQVDTLIESSTPELYSAISGSGNPSQVPVFIVGMPRSGTSLVEQIAATHSCVSGGGELKDIAGIVDALQAHGRDRPADQLDPDLARRLADDHVAHLESLGGGAARVVDKLPDNIFNAGLIAVLFPQSRIIFCRRDPRDICLSCYFRRLDPSLTWSYDLVDCGLRALEVERLANHWRKVLPLRMLTIDYEALVADLEGESRRLIEFLGLEWEPACLDFYKTDRPILTGSAWQVRQPLFNRSVGRWRKYERHLGPLLEVLAEGRVAA